MHNTLRVVDIIQILIQSLFNFIQNQDQSLKGGENFDKIFTETLKDILKDFKSAHFSFQDIIDELIERGNLQNQDENSLKQLLSYIQKNFQPGNLEDKDSSSDGQNKQDGEKSGININDLGTLFYLNFATQNLPEDINKEENPSFSSIEIKPDVEGKVEKGMTYEAGKVRIEGEILLKEGEIYQNLKTSVSNLTSNIKENNNNIKENNIKENVVKENAQNTREDIANQNKQTDKLSDILKNADQRVNEIEKNTDKKVDIYLEANEKLSSDAVEEFKLKEKIQNDKDSKAGNILNNKDGNILNFQNDSKDGNILNNKDGNILNFQNDIDTQKKGEGRRS